MFSNIKLRFLEIVLINVNLTACANFLGSYYMVLVHNKIQISISVSVCITVRCPANGIEYIL